MRGTKAKAHRRALAHENQQLGAAVNANREAALMLYGYANSYMWQAFWQSVALAALLNYLDNRRGSPEGLMCIAPFSALENAVLFWPADVVI